MSELREIVNELWRRGNLSFMWHKGQKKINELFEQTQQQLFVGNISRQWGKSFWAVSKAIGHCLQGEKRRVRYGTAFHTDLVEFILPTFELVLETCPVEIRPKYKIVGSKWMFPNGSEIKLVGLDKNPNSLRGNKLDMIILDEAGFVANLDYLYTSVIIPATTHRPDCKIIMISTPPSTPAHPYCDFIAKAEVEGSYAHLTIYDNPLINEETINRLMKESGGPFTTTWRREYLGELVTDSDLAIIPEWKDEFVVDIPEDEYTKFYHRYVGMDLGVRLDFTAAIFGYWHFKMAALVIEDEYHISGPSMNTENLVADLKAKEQELWGEIKPFRRIADNNWPLTLLDLSSIHNMPFISTSKDVLETMINELRLMVQNRQVIVHPRCKYLIGCLKYGVWDIKRTKFSRSKVYGHFDHLAALVYLVRNLLKNSNPIPLDYGHESFRSWKVHLGQKRSANMNTLEKLFTPKPRKLHG